MTEHSSETIGSVGEFLVHALELENESALRYHELADSMEVHHNPEVGGLFRKLAEFSEMHAAEVKQRASGIDLPEIAPWDFKWNCPSSPESGCEEGDVSYLMTTAQALALALHNETRGREFYAEVAKSSPDDEVRRMAAEMADEEDQHVVLLRRWIERASHRSDYPREDLDPPNMPE